MNNKRDIITMQPVKPVQADGSENTLAEYASICWRRVWLIAIVTVGITVAVATWSFLQTPIYGGKATIVIEQEGPAALEKDRPVDNSPEYFQTHFELMRSHQVLQKTAQLLHLSERPEYQPHPFAMKDTVLAFLTGAIRELLQPKENASETPDEDKEDVLLRGFSQQIEIMPVRGARLAHITVNSEDPKFAALAANTLASVYIEHTQELSARSKKKAAQWFMGHLDDLRDKVEASQQALYLFRSKHGLVEGHQRQAVAAQSLAELNSELVKAEMKKADAKTRFRQIESVLGSRSENGAIDWSNLDASTEVLSSPLIQTLRAQQIRASGQVAELSDKYGPLHPKMARAKAELQDLHERIQHEVRKIYDSVKREYDMAYARERAIQEAVNRYRDDKLKVGQYEIEHGILEREAQSNQHMYDIFLKVAKEADLSSGIRASNVYLADPAVPSSIPVKPKKKLNIMLGLLTGLMSGLGLALIVESRDRSLKGPGDVERYLPSVALLGVVPLLPKRDTANRAVLLPANSPSPVAESLRTIRTSLLLRNPSKLPSCVLITSPGETEGKTTLAVNLATAMAQLEDIRVILIDADLRQPDPHPIYAIQTGNGKPKGLVDFLAGRASFQEVVHQTTEVANLSVIPRGECPRNPSELLYSRRMSELLRCCRTEGFHVFVDAPPVLCVTDPVVLAPQVDGVLLVVSAGETTREATQSAIQRLTTAGGNFLGVVLQKANVTESPYYAASHYNWH